jgi:hypothetical protein
LIDRLPNEKDAGAVYAMLLALGTYPQADIGPSQKEHLLPWLCDCYRTHPDSGVHSAAGWLLKRWDKARRDQCDQTLKSAGLSAKRDWYVNSLGQTMIVIREPQEFLYGSPPKDGEAPSQDKRVRCRIPYAFAIADSETTCEQFAKFRTNYVADRTMCPDVRCPVLDISFHDAAAFCRSLSEREDMRSRGLAVHQSSSESAAIKSGRNGNTLAAL